MKVNEFLEKDCDLDLFKKLASKNKYYKNSYFFFLQNKNKYMQDLSFYQREWLFQIKGNLLDKMASSLLRKKGIKEKGEWVEPYFDR